MGRYFCSSSGFDDTVSSGVAVPAAVSVLSSGALVEVDESDDVPVLSSSANNKVTEHPNIKASNADASLLFTTIPPLVNELYILDLRTCLIRETPAATSMPSVDERAINHLRNTPASPDVQTWCMTDVPAPICRTPEK